MYSYYRQMLLTSNFIIEGQPDFFFQVSTFPLKHFKKLQFSWLCLNVPKAHAELLSSVTEYSAGMWAHAK